MMSGSSLETSIDIWGETATDLLKIDESEKTRDVIQQNTDTIHKILGKKFSEEEAKLREEIKREKEAIQTLKGRIQESQSETYNSSDAYLFDATTLYQRIKQQEWRKVYDMLTDQTKDSETIICVTLIYILKECYTQCHHKIQSVCEEIKHDIASPGSSQTQKPKVDKKTQSKQKSKEPDELSNITEEFLKKTGPGIFPYHKQALIDHVTKSKEYGSVPVKDKETEETFRNYITKCLEFCWMQILENKDVTLEDNLKNLSKIMPHKYKQIQASKVTVTWPALVDTGNTVEDAVLESKDNMHAARLSKKQKESKSNGKSKSEETEDITEQDNIDSQEISKPVGKGKNGQHSEADKTKGSHSKLTGEVKQEEPKNNDTGRGAHAEKPKIQQELNRSRRDGPTVMSDRQKVTPRAEIDEKNSNNTKIGNQTQKKETNEPSAGGREQISKAQQNTNF